MVVIIFECFIFKEVFFNVIFGLFIVIVVLCICKGKLNLGVCINNLLKLIIFWGIYNELFFFFNFVLIFVMFNVNFVLLVLKKREFVCMEKLIIGIVEFCFFGVSLLVLVVLLLYILSEFFIFVCNLFIFNLYCKVIIFVVFWGLVEIIFVFIWFIFEINFLLFNIIFLIFNLVCKVLLLLNFKLVLFKKLKFLVVFFNLKFFKVNFFFNLICLIFCFFKEERWYFKFKFVFNLLWMVIFFCKGKVLVKVFKLIVDLVWSVISGFINKFFILVFVRILVCVFLKWRIFKFKNEGLWCIKLIYDLKLVVKLLIL